AAQKSGAIRGKTPEELAQAALAARVISAEEQALLKRAAQLRDDAIRVDHFPQDLGLSEAIRPAQRARAAACTRAQAPPVSPSYDAQSQLGSVTGFVAAETVRSPGARC